MRLESRVEWRVANRRVEYDPRFGSKFYRDAYCIEKLEYDSAETRILIATKLKLAWTAQMKHVFFGPRGMLAAAVVERSTTIHC